MKHILLATTILAVTSFAVNAAGITVSSKTKEVIKTNEPGAQISGEVVEIKPNQPTKADIKPVSSIQDNKVTVNGGTIPVKDKIFGADSIKNDVQNNTVTLNKGGYLADIFGAQSYNKDAIFNTVNIEGIDSYGTVFGGISYHGDANNNTVKINDSNMTRRVLGGHSNNKNAANNKVEVTNSKVREAMYGGFSYTGDAVNNSMLVKDTVTMEKVYGGFSRDSNCKNNKLTINNSNTLNILYGGASTNGTVSANELIIESGNIAGDIYGGYSDFGNVSANTLTIKGGKFNRNIYDGYSQSGKVENNRIIIEGGEFPRTASIVANFVTLSNKPALNSNLVISGRCNDKTADGTDCLIKFTNFKGGAFKSIAKAKKVEIDADSVVALTEVGPVKIDGDLDIAGTFGFYHNAQTPSSLIVNNLTANDAKFMLTNFDLITIKGIATGTATVDVRFPNENKLPKAFRVFDGDTSAFEYTLKNEYILYRDGWHSLHIAIDPKQKNQVNVVSPKTIHADNTSLAVPIEAKQDVVDKIEISNNGSINIANGTANLITANEMSVKNGTVFMDYNDYFRLAKPPVVDNGNLVINVGSVNKEGKYKIFINTSGETIKENSFSVTFTEQNDAFNYAFKDGILEITKRQ